LLLRLFIPGRPKPKQRLRFMIAGRWGKYKESKLLAPLKKLLDSIKWMLVAPEAPGDEMKELIKENQECLSAIDNLPEGHPKVVGFTPSDTADWESFVAKKARNKFKGSVILREVAIFFRFIYAKRNFPDTSNIVKSVEDGLQKAGIFKNDKQVGIHVTFRDYVKSTRLEGTLLHVFECFQVSEIEGQDGKAKSDKTRRTGHADSVQSANSHMG